MHIQYKHEYNILETVMTREQRRNETTELKDGLWRRLNHTCGDHDRLPVETSLTKILPCGRILLTLISHHKLLQIYKASIANKSKTKTKSTGTYLNLQFCYTLERKNTRTKKPEVSIEVTSVWIHAT